MDVSNKRKRRNPISVRAKWDWINQKYKIPNDDNMIILGELTWDEISEILAARDRGLLKGSPAFWHNLGNEIDFRRSVGYRERKRIKKALL